MFCNLHRRSSFRFFQFAVVTICLQIGPALLASGNHRLLIDDFNDGNTIGWTPLASLDAEEVGIAKYDASSGTLIMAVDEEVPVNGQDYLIWDESRGNTFYTNGILEATATILDSGSGVGLGIRMDVRGNADWPEDGYASGLGPTAPPGIFRLAPSNPFGSPFAGEILDFSEVAIQSNVAYRLQVKMDGPTISTKIWEDGDAMPEESLVMTTNADVPGGVIALGGLNASGFPAAPSDGPINVSFDNITFTQLMPGDFDNNKQLDVGDLDLLSSDIRSEKPHLIFDMNNDGQIDYADREFWIVSLANTYIGDSNLDGEFNTGDFIEVFQAGKYETGELAHWNEGDWNGDQLFDSGDFIAAFQHGGYELGARPAVITVPETSSLAFGMIIGVLSVGRIRKPRQAVVYCPSAG